MTHAYSAKNVLLNRGGVNLCQFAFGRTPRLPSDLPSLHTEVFCKTASCVVENEEEPIFRTLAPSIATQRGVGRALFCLARGGIWKPADRPVVFDITARIDLGMSMARWGSSAPIVMFCKFCVCFT